MRVDERASAFLLPRALRLAGKSPDTLLSEYLANERLSSDELAALQWSKLETLVAHSYEHVPYYRARFEELGAHPSDIRTLHQYAKLPLVTKQVLREHPTDLMADDRSVDHLKVVYTGGSTGEPVAMQQDWEYYRRGQAVFQRNMRWAGYVPGERQAWFMRPEYSSGSRRVRLALERKWIVGIAINSPKALAEWAEGMRVRQPRFVYGSASAIGALASFALDRDLRFDSVRHVVTTSETLTPQMREDIGTAFGAPVFSQYGCTEVYSIAQECAHGTMHINSDLNLVEFVPISKPGGLTGHQVVVTPLPAFAQPLLRFAPGDQAEPLDGPCPCGLPFPIMGPVEGRVDDTITFSGGAQISAMLLERIVRAIPGVARFQFKQTSRDAVQLLVVPDRRFSEESRVLLGKIQDQLSRQAGVSIAIEPVLVDEIAVLPNGKHASLVRLEDRTPR